jgi:hypothetical protein
MVLLMDVSVPQIKCHQIVDLLVNNELESKWKDALSLMQSAMVDFAWKDREKHGEYLSV